MTISGRTISVELRQWGARDDFGNDIESYAAPIAVDNVAIQPGRCEDLDTARPEGVLVALTLHFPKTWTQSLRGARVTITGRWAGTYSVIGDPVPYDEQNCPPLVPWNMPVEVERVDG